jgi:hypothetical protein
MQFLFHGFSLIILAHPRTFVFLFGIAGFATLLLRWPQGWTDDIITVTSNNGLNRLALPIKGGLGLG